MARLFIILRLNKEKTNCNAKYHIRVKNKSLCKFKSLQLSIPYKMHSNAFSHSRLTFAYSLCCLLFLFICFLQTKAKVYFSRHLFLYSTLSLTLAPAHVRHHQRAYFPSLPSQIKALLSFPCILLIFILCCSGKKISFVLMNRKSSSLFICCATSFDSLI